MEQPLKILLVEDDEDDAFFIKDLLQDLAFRPSPSLCHVTSGKEALMRLAVEPFDVCMFDFRLGSQDGIDLLREARKQGVQAPIIFLTGQGDQETAVRAMKSGATDYLTKHRLTPDNLFHSIRFAVQLKKEEDLRKRAEEELKKSNDDLKRINAELQASMEKLTKAQDQIVQSEKLASVGRLAAGVCHEILNPLNIISGHVQALSLERPEDQGLAEDLQSIMEEINRIEKIISGLLKFSRKEAMVFKLTHMNDELESVLSITEREMQLDGLGVVRKFAEGLPPLKVDADRLRQVFLNLINNARYAMSPGGTLTVTTRLMKDQNQSGQTVRIPIDPRKDPVQGEDTWVRIEFADTGTGIAKEHLDKLFEPFFTTKPEDKGTGLGLSVCYSIIEKHGGSLSVESEEGLGATFIIDLPVHCSIPSESLIVNEE